MMVQKTRNTNLWRSGALPALVGLLLGAILLNACSSAPGAKANSAPQNVAQAPALSSTLQQEGNAELSTFHQWISLMQQNGGDVSSYQQQYANDQQALTQASTNTAYTTALKALQSHTQAIELPAMKQECLYLQQQLQQQVSSWSAQHTYHDNYNSTTYKLGYEYDNVGGIGGPDWALGELNASKTLANYQQTVEDLNIWLANFQAMMANFGDKTPFNQAHKADLDLLQHYGDMQGRAVVVSLSEQALRVYENGKLVNAFLVTTGQPNLPSLPGAWWIEGKQHPTTFKSSDPKGSPNWYADTFINYAMQYHSNGYFFHDAWWRTQFGPGTNYPHQDPSGDPFAGRGSHGCVNMSVNDAAWLYGFVSVYTNVLIY